ncbi:MAG TPA: tripartite tricarboxylate transporter TctB family protein [Devosia sp.]|nr:tripartite tricarboxylate transporter TctB family protein [Devosia sp.]
MNGIAFDRANLLCGLVFIAFGAFFGIQSLGMEIGTALRMGPGYFPLVLSGVLVLVGLIIIVQATQVKGEPIGPIAWRGALFILPAPILFGLTIRPLGFVVALLITASVAAFASRRMKPHWALVLVLAITVFAVGVFSYGLGLPMRRFGPWLDFLGWNF